MHEILDDISDPNIVGFKFNDHLTEEDYDAFVSQVKHNLERHTTTRVFFELEDVDGWSPENQWEDLAFDVRHVSDLDKVAVVGDESSDFWDTWTDKVELLFPLAELETFPSEDRDEALEWIRGDMEVPGIGPGSMAEPHADSQDE